MTWQGRLRARFRGFGGWALAGPARKPDPGLERSDLPIRAPAMDARFRRICAVFADGRCLIAEGYEPDDRLRLDLVALRQAGAIPQVLMEESATLEEIAALWRASGTLVPGTGGAAVDGGGAARRLRALLADAAAARASDVVFENGRDACKVFCIVNDRKLPLTAPLTAEEGQRVMGFLFHCKDEGSSQTSYRRSSFQGFSIRAGGAVPLPGGISALRCERGPHDPDADHLFARLFYTDRLDADMTLERLGFSAEEAALFAEIRMAMQGGVFIGGRAGDGKSTTLAVNLALQMAEMDGSLNLVTLEDPVEYRIPGAIQIAVPTAGAGETRAGHFKEALMHFCRVHPASGMVSEIRDADAARQVLQCVDTGHQIWTTIHVHNANAIPFRLIDMGIGAAEMAKPGNVALLMKQTLLPKLCPACALDRPAEGRAVPEGLVSRLGGLEGLRFRNAAGCAECRRSRGGEVSARAWNGYLGQTAIAETIRPDAGYLGFVRAGDPLGAWAYWRKEMGGVPIGVRIRALVKQGAVDPFDALLKGGAGEHEAQADPRPECPRHECPRPEGPVGEAGGGSP
ncbi:MAG: ATPase, T2SS/T4P/T4SS family [Rhodospirillales bacterium]|nr:ATPase, T2SS/T4P/T4SS family [Rhodospirillales bacterium]